MLCKLYLCARNRSIIIKYQLNNDILSIIYAKIMKFYTNFPTLNINWTFLIQIIEFD
jgi:hypothetical protein